VPAVLFMIMSEGMLSVRSAKHQLGQCPFLARAVQAVDGRWQTSQTVEWACLTAMLGSRLGYVISGAETVTGADASEANARMA
jgi:hypothetical protein